MPQPQPPLPPPGEGADARALDLGSLAGNSAGSSKARHGGSVYDALIAEIKALKLAQKAAPRALRVRRAPALLGPCGPSLRLGIGERVRAYELGCGRWNPRHCQRAPARC